MAFKHQFATVLALLAAFAAGGCSTFDKGKTDSSPWSISKLWKKEYQSPASLAVIWSPDVLTTPGAPPQRGFGGRVFFYNEKQQAIPVEGDLMVHGYFGEATRFENNGREAAKKFPFMAEQLTKHFSPSQLGASYSIWVPWDEATGAFQEQITLIPTFKDGDGKIVQGAPAKLLLPGKEKQPTSKKRSIPAQAVSYRRSSMPTNNGYNLPEIKTKDMGKMRTTTIEVPSGASLSKRSSTERLSLELGGGRVGGTQREMPSSGVSVGGSRYQSFPTNVGTPQASADAIDDAVINRLKRLDRESLPAVKLRSLPSPGTTDGPLAGQRRQLPNVANLVRQASYSTQPE